MNTAQFHLFLATLHFISLAHLKQKSNAVLIHVLLMFVHGALALIYRFFP